MAEQAFGDATLAYMRKLQESQQVEPSRRFTDKKELAPAAVRGLDASHAAMRENRTLFPSTVVEVTEDEPERLLVSGKNNRKLGDEVAKGRFKGYALYGLSLEERATCPSDCAVRDICYGNGMQMARRHRIGDPDVFYDRLGFEIADLLQEHGGVLIRLHVLGDFPSVEYVANWADLLEENEDLAVYGYTARKPGSEIGDAIAAVKERFPERFRIRWSGPIVRADGATVIDHVPDGPKHGDALVCPAQTDATACCSTCGLCWDTETPIAFVRHGPKSADVQAEAEMKAAPATAEGLRRVQALSIPGAKSRAVDVAPPPEPTMVAPDDLHIEPAYQRDLSKRSMALIRKMVLGWDWAKFKPPIVAERGDDLVVIDGQHTAIAAATLRIKQMPVLVVTAEEIEKRADAFVAHNRDRLVMHPLQIFHASAIAGDGAARSILELARSTGVSIPRSPPRQGKAKPGDIIAINDVRRIYVSQGETVVFRIFMIAAGAQAAPSPAPRRGDWRCF